MFVVAVAFSTLEELIFLELRIRQRSPERGKETANLSMGTVGDGVNAIRMEKYRLRVVLL
jgi:hypothetical protein